ncbi:MAG TPA: SdrD B-like domain-containing protein, partial [Micavibrio sp.]
IFRASTSLGPYDTDGGYNMVSESQRRLTPVQAHVFLDRNLNDIYDDGDEELPQARLQVNNQLSARADAHGLVVARPYQTGGLSAISLAASSLEDPYHVPAHDGYQMALRPGALPRIEFPVIETGAIDGYVYAADAQSPVQGLRVQLLDQTGNFIRDTKASYDGFYTFEFLRPGQYLVRVDPLFSQETPAQRVVIAPDQMFASGIDMALIPTIEPAGGAAP